MMVYGYAEALQRLEATIESKDADRSFHAVFESLNWATSVDDRIRKHWAPEGKALDWAWRSRVDGAELMAGVRFARNRVHHHWADAIYLNDTGGLTLPMTFPMHFSTWRWLAADDLPAGEDDQGRDVYATHLQDQPVVKTLLVLGLVFEKVLPLLEPPTPASGASA